MIEFTITFNEADLRRWYAATHKLEKEANKEWDENPKRNAIGYSNLLITNIMMQKGMGHYPSYHPYYAYWKAQYGLGGGGFWRLMGDLVKSITHFRVTETRKKQWKSYMGGVPSSAVDSGGKSWFGRGDKGPPKRIAMYGYVMEYGGTWAKAGVHPPRPLFGPTAEEYQKVQWWKELEVTRSKLVNTWS